MKIIELKEKLDRIIATHGKNIDVEIFDEDMDIAYENFDIDKDHIGSDDTLYFQINKHKIRK